jgi:multidrug efflux pump subunit AcrA (membrane-fusion protein)
MKGEVQMASKQRPLKIRLIRASDTLFDILGLRPLGILVFAGSALLFLYVIGLSAGATRADAVAVAGLVNHPSLVSSFTTQVFVKPGDRVEVGAPLVELSSHFIDQDLERIDLELDLLVNESKLRRAQHDEDRLRLEATTRAESSKASVVDRLAEAHFEKQIAVLRHRRKSLIEKRDALVVTAHSSGIVADVTRVGASIAEGASVASVMPPFAEEIVAYVAPTIDPSRIEKGVAAYLLGASTEDCQAPGRVRNRGARVEEAPKQLTQLMGLAIHGMPVHITIPRDCRLINGQVLALNFRNEDA